jgi:hypothetical protein
LGIANPLFDAVGAKKSRDVTQNFLRHNRAQRKSNLQT